MAAARAGCEEEYMGLPSDKGFKIRVPHAYTIIFLLMVVFAILTWIVPSGAFERQ